MKVRVQIPEDEVILEVLKNKHLRKTWNEITTEERTTVLADVKELLSKEVDLVIVQRGGLGAKGEGIEVKEEMMDGTERVVRVGVGYDGVVDKWPWLGDDDVPDR